MRDDDDEWELSREAAHPTGRRLMEAAFFWDCLDQSAPFGSDTGADVLAMFRDWLVENPGRAALPFLEDLLSNWDVSDEHWEVVDEGSVGRLIHEDSYSFQHRDDAVIALAFAQLALAGTIEPIVAERAERAVRRQLLAPALEAWVPEHRSERVQHLETMRRVLAQARSLAP